LIDYFNSIFTAVATELRKQVPGIFVTGEINDSNVKKFPCVQIEENSNLPVHRDSASKSKYAAVSLRVRVYSNKTSGRIAEARSIVSIVDSVLEPLNFYRKSFAPLNGLYNNSVYRIDCSYGATIGEDGMIYRN
jgi:hypothetical protein